MDFANVTAVTIPEGSVNMISQSGMTLWEKKNNGKYTFTVIATNTAGADSRGLSIMVRGA